MATTPRDLGAWGSSQGDWDTWGCQQGEEKADFKAAATRTGFVTNCRDVDFNQVKGAVVVAGGEAQE